MDSSEIQGDGTADPGSKRRLSRVIVGGVLESAGFFFILAAMEPDGVPTAASVAWFALAESLWFLALGFAIAASLRFDGRRMEAVVGSSVGLLVPGFIGWIVVGSLPGFAGEPFWRVLITLTGALIGGAFCSVVMSYAGGRLAERLLRLASD